MSKAFSPTIEFNCTNGCELYGACPGHELRIVHLLTSGHVAIEERNKSKGAEWQRLVTFDDGTWCALLEADKQERAARPAIIKQS